MESAPNESIEVQIKVYEVRKSSDAAKSFYKK